MDSFPDVTPLWDLSADLVNLQDSDFMQLLQKQYPTGAINPQNLSAYTLTPPSEDVSSSPSPPNSNNENNNEDSPTSMNQPDSALKRKASEDDFEEGPSQKSQHTVESRKSSSASGSASRRKASGSGGTGKDETRLMKRKEQNRAAQRAFRERKEKHVKDLEDKVSELEAKNELTQHENENLKDILQRLQSENVALKQSGFSFTVPKDIGSTSQSSSIPIQNFGASSPTHVTPKYTNPLDWSSLTTFDPAMLNLLDDSVPQPTATEGAMQMDFGFGQTTGLAANSPYTTIASNPLFMSLTSTFDGLSPMSTDSPSANTYHSNNTNSNNSGFNFDFNNLAPWPPTQQTQDPSNFDDLFQSYLGSLSTSDMSFVNLSPASISPVSHHLSPQSIKNIPSPLSTSSASSPLVSTPDSAGSADKDTVVHGDQCPRSKSELSKIIASEGDSPFAPPSAIRKSTDDVLGTMIECSGSSFPKTTKSDQNVEVLTAWRSITSNPEFKDLDMNNLCQEFTRKARCDGTKVVLEPSGVHQILESIATKKQ